MPTRRWLSPFLWLCLMGGLAIFSSTMSKNPALPLFIRSFGVPPGTLGLIAAASTVTGIVVSLPAGVLSDQWGRRRVILLSMAVFASAPFLYLLVRFPWQLVLVRVYHGLATAILGPVAMAAVADTYQQGRGERMAWYSSATMLLWWAASWRQQWVGSSSSGRTSALSTWDAGWQGRSPCWQRLGSRVLRSPVNLLWWTHHQGTKLPSVSAGRKRGMSCDTSSPIVAFWSPVWLRPPNTWPSAVETYLPLYLTDIGLTPLQIGPLFTAQALAIALTKPLMGRLSDPWGRKRSIMASLFLGALIVAAMPQTRAYALLACLAVLFGVGMAMVTASTSALVSELSREGAYGSALGVLSSIMDVGHTSGPVIGGQLVQMVGYGGAFAGVGGILGLIAVAFTWLAREPRLGARRATS